MKSLSIRASVLASLAAALPVAAFTFATVSAPASARGEDLKVAYVNMQRALEETEEGRKTKAALRKDLEGKQKELDEQQEELKKMMEDLEKKRSLLPADTQRQKEGEIRTRLEKVQQAYLRHQQELAGKEQNVMGAVVGRIQRIVAKIAATEGFSLVFDQGQAGLLFAKPHLEITNEVIRRVNAGEGAADGAKKPTATPPAAAKPKK